MFIIINVNHTILFTKNNMGSKCSSISQQIKSEDTHNLFVPDMDIECSYKPTCRCYDCFTHIWNNPPKGLYTIFNHTAFQQCDCYRCNKLLKPRIPLHYLFKPHNCERM